MMARPSPSPWRASRLLLALALLVAPGCSVWNAPDRGRLDAGLGADAPDLDAATDGDLDGAADGGLDAPDGGPPRTERRCADDLDDDMDGFIDCADLDCATDVMACCSSGGSAVVNDAWTSAALTGWSRLPTGLDGPNAPTGAGQPLSRFTSTRSNFARAIIHDPVGAATGCIAIDPGVVITTSLRLMDDSIESCPEDECDERAGILLTAVQPATAVASYSNGDVLPDELGVRLRRLGSAMGRVEVTVAGSIVSTLAVTNDVVSVEIQLVPGVDEDGTPVSVTTVTLTPSGTPTPVLALDRAPALARSTLLGAASGCAGGRGLYLAVEGVGNRVGVGTLRVVPQVCPNPNYFRSAGDPLEASDLGASAGWTAGGVGAPSLFYSDDDGAAAVVDRWDVFFDASDRNRANETFATVRFAAGGTIFIGDELLAGGGLPRASGAPLVDAAFPTCGGTCTESNRDPDFWFRQNAERELDSSSGWLVWSRRTAAGVWQIMIDSLETSAGGTIGGPEVLLTTAASGGAAAVTECTALRSPALVARPDGGLWVFFVCEHGGMPGDVRVAELSATTGALEAVRPAPVLTPAMAPYARLGIQDVDAEVWTSNLGTENAEVIVRLWFVARAGGLPVVGLAEGVSRGLDADLPMLGMFAGNPVLRSDDERLPACTGLCRITSIAAGRGGIERDVRFLVALSDEATGSTRHLLVPLEQTVPLR